MDPAGGYGRKGGLGLGRGGSTRGRRRGRQPNGGCTLSTATSPIKKTHQKICWGGWYLAVVVWEAIAPPPENSPPSREAQVAICVFAPFLTVMIRVRDRICGADGVGVGVRVDQGSSWGEG